MNKITKKAYKDFSKNMDKNKDGYITEDEYVNVILNMDKN